MIYNFFKPFIKANPFAFVALLIAPLVMVIESNIIPYGLKLLVDALSDHPETKVDTSAVKKLYYPMLVIVVAWIFKTVITRLCYYLETKTVPRFQRNIRIYCFNQVLSYHYNFFLTNLSGDIASKINNLPQSCETIRQLVCWNIVSSVIIVLFSFVMLYRVGYQFSLLMICWVIVHSVIIFCSIKKIEHASEKHAQQQSMLSGYIVDTISNILSFKAFTHKKNTNHVLNQQDQEMESHMKMMKQIYLFQVISDIPIVILITLTLYYLVQLWSCGNITNGDFVLVFNVIISVMYSIVGLGYVITDIFREMGRIKQALKLIMQNEKLLSESSNSNRLVISDGKVKFTGVTFGYTDQLIFKNLSLSFLPGKKIAIAGVSGSGKSSLLRLLFRFYKINSGMIEIDDQDIANVSINSLRSQITYIPQHITLFHQSIRDNIGYGSPNAADEEIIAAAKKACCHEFIVRLREGYNTVVGEDGSLLSGGQKQRIMLARGLLKNSKIFIFDEIASAQDMKTEYYIQKSLGMFCKDKTVIFVSHSLSTFTMADEVILLHDGQIIAQGPHNTLIETNPHYQSFIQHKELSLPRNIV
ncbi:MAG TPA: ABC transporter ATP-binding protein [Candidatus Megaira endosymbiont of Nemacystus decipiens]|nr:ABC transporter ATP-binding protein [Candidatus Megaera endosymbiont of Nemacystus decipiens]